MYHNYLKKKNKNKEDDKDIIDLTNATSKKTVYTCKSCDNTKLIDYSQGQLYNPFAGECYICPSCGKIYDSSLEKLPHAPSKVRSSLGQNDNPLELIFETIAEDRGTVSRFSDNIIFDSSRGDEYAKDDLKETQKKE
jgi:hypothetical protein